MKTVAAAFPSMIEADQVSHELARLGVPTEDISIIAGNDKNRHDEYLKKAKQSSESTQSAAASGASFGGGMGIVATLIALAIPGVGPIYALGPLAIVIAGLGVGATTGGLISAFHNMGIHHEEAPLYEEAVRRGAVMVTATVSEEVEQEAVAVMKRHGARDLRDQADTWSAHPYPSDDSITSSEMPETVDEARRS